MESSKQPAKYQANEIDLLELFARAIQAIRKNFATVLVSFLVGCGLGLLYYQFTPKMFESRMFISSDILTEPYSKSVIDNLDKLIRENNTQSLAEKLNLPIDKVSSVANITITSAVEKPEGSETGRIYFHIKVSSANNLIWPELQDAIVNYIKNNEFVKIRVEHRKKYISQVIEKINLELTDLERLKTKISEDGLAQSSKQNLVLFDPTTVNSK